MVQPNIGWIQPDGEFIDVANQGYTHEAFAADFLLRQAEVDSSEPYIPSLELIKMGWVRYTAGSVEGMPEHIAKHWRVIRGLVEDDLANGAYKLKDAYSHFDIYPDDPYDYDLHRTFRVPMTEMLRPRRRALRVARRGPKGSAASAWRAREASSTKIQIVKEPKKYYAGNRCTEPWVA